MNFTCFESGPPQPIDVKTTNILATNSAEVHLISYLQTSVFKIHLVFIIYGCYWFSFNSPLLPTLTYVFLSVSPLLKLGLPEKVNKHKTLNRRA